jgi:hypothetical protein
MKSKLFLVVMLVLGTFPGALLAQTRDALIGTWKLVSATDTTDKGITKDAFGKDPVGFLTYTPDGRMSATIAFGGRKPLSVPDYIAAPAEERAEAFSTFSAYAGSYTHTGNIVVHHVEVAALQNRVNTDLTRTIAKLDQNYLILRTPPYLKGGVMVNTELVWERLTSGETRSR